MADGAPPKIRIVPDKKADTLTVIDNGIGMDRQELIDNLGTIARSGTKSFLSRLTEAKDGAGLIGQFGVGFYAAFMVADRIVVTSRRAGTDQAWVWSSSGGSGFEIAPGSEDRRETPDPGHRNRPASESRTRKNISRPMRSSASSAPIPTTSSFRSSWFPKRASRARSIRPARCGSGRNPN